MGKAERRVLENIYAEKEYMDRRVSEGIEKYRKGDMEISVVKDGKTYKKTVHHGKDGSGKFEIVLD